MWDNRNSGMEAAVRFLIIIALFATGVTGQVAREANREYATAEERAKLVPRLENPARLARIRPTELVKRLDVRPGSVVVDLGTGTGNLLAALSKAVGPKGRVVAQDIHSDFLDRARSRANSDGLDNVDFVLGTETDPHLPEGMADLVIVLDAYHHFDYPEKMLAAIRRGLKPGGRLAITRHAGPWRSRRIPTSRSGTFAEGQSRSNRRFRRRRTVSFGDGSMPPAVSTSPCFRSTDVARPSPGFEATSGASTVGLAHRDVTTPSRLPRRRSGSWTCVRRYC
jgi:SAM-dependent methyltransferase